MSLFDAIHSKIYSLYTPGPQQKPVCVKQIVCNVCVSGRDIYCVYYGSHMYIFILCVLCVMQPPPLLSL
jgi:hypothetical protein